jgi:elongation of very long chain fatty acids protein 4
MLCCLRALKEHEVVQVLLNVWCVAEFIREVAGFGEAQGMTFWGNTYDPSIAGFKVGFVIWIHYNNKYVELLDTLWMLLRKKNQQVRFALGHRVWCGSASFHPDT